MEENTMLKRLLALLLVVIFSLTAFPAFAAPGGGNVDNEAYYQAVAQLIESRWDDNFFSEATLSVGSDTLVVDNRSIKLVNPAEVLDGELILPSEVFDSLGAKTATDPQGVTISRKGTNIEIKFGEESIKINGNKKGVPAPSAIKNGKPVLPASILGELGLGFEINWNEATGEVTITNEYQMARLAAKVRPGASPPGNVGAVRVISGPDGLCIYQFDNEQQAKEAFKTLNASRDIIYVTPDTYVYLEEEKTPIEFAPAYETTAIYQHMSWGVARIDSDKFLDYLIANGKQNANVIVAVLDTGLDKSHPYFVGRYLTGRNFTDTSQQNNPYDVHSHGTHVAGTVVDITIALPNVKILPVKVLGDTGSGSATNIGNGIRWAADNGAKVINMSLGGGCSSAEDDAIAYAVGKGANVVVSAGNHGGDSTATRYCPAHNMNAITVASIDSQNRPAASSGYGACVDVAAPGVSVLSTIPGGGSAYKSGTSMAAPHVSGAVALLLCDNPSLTPTAVQNTIRASVDSWAAPANARYGTGILNIGKSAGGLPPQIIIQPAVVDLHLNTTQQLKVDYFANGTVTNVTSSAAYSSSNPNVASVSGTGLLTGSAVGAATITATYNGTSGISNVTVANDNTRFEGAIPITAHNMIPVSVTAGLQIRYFSFVPTDTGSHTIESFNRGSSDPYGYLYNSNRVLLASNDDGGTTESLNFRIVYNLIAGQTYYIGAGCYSSGTGSYQFQITAPTPAIQPSEVTVTPESATVTINTTQQLAATVLPNNAANRTVTWSSSNTTVATVSTTGLVTARAVGTATITARTVNGLTAACVITVPDTIPPVITLQGNANMTINRGSTFTEPGYTAIDNVDGNITSRVVVTGFVDANVIGVYTLLYEVADNAGNVGRATRTVTVRPNQANFSFSDKGKAGNSFNHNLLTTFPGTATITPVGVDGKTTITVTIRNSAGAAVFTRAFSTNSPGTVDLPAGSYTLNLRIDSANGNVSVGANVALVETQPPPPPTLVRITADPPSANMTAGGSRTVSVTAVYSDNSTALLSSGVSLSSSNTQVVTVSGMTINAVAAGTATVTASYSDKTVAIPVTVTAPTLKAPTISLIGSAQIVLHLGGSPYFEQGATAIDEADGNISSQVVINSNVNTDVAGHYTVVYTVTNSAGLSASVTRNVEIVAPVTQTLPGASFSFAPKGKQGESFTYNIAVAAAGNTSLTVTVPNKTAVQVTINNGSVPVVYTERFEANASRSIPGLSGDYTVKVEFVAANGNTTVNLGVTTPGGTQLVFPKPEVTR